METPVTVPFFQRTWVKYGMIGGLIVSLLMAAYYIIDENLLFERWTGIVSMVILFVVGILAAIEKKKQMGGLIPFGVAVGTSLGALMIGVVIFNIVNLLFFYVLDPHLMGLAVQKMKEAIYEQESAGKVTKQQADQILSTYTNMGPNLFLIQIISSFFVFGILGLIIYLISSAIIRKEPK